MNAVVRISAAGVQSIVGRYAMREPTAVPNGFAKVCQQQGWPIEETWQRLSDLRRPWFEADNGAYMYFNIADGQWWIDEPGGAGVYVPQLRPPFPGSGTRGCVCDLGRCDGRNPPLWHTQARGSGSGCLPFTAG